MIVLSETPPIEMQGTWHIYFSDATTPEDREIIREWFAHHGVKGDVSVISARFPTRQDAAMFEMSFL